MGIREDTTGRVLAVDDQQRTLSQLALTLKTRGHIVETARDAVSALKRIASTPPEVIILGTGLPNIGGLDMCRQLKQNPATRLIPVVMVAVLNSREHRIEGIRAGADDVLGKPFDAEELCARVSSLLRIKRYTDELDSAESVILSLALTVEARDPYTDGHCHRLATYASALGRQIGLSCEEIAALHRGGYLHDVGKIGIADSILQKPGPLSVAEYELMKAHTVIGARLCGDLRSLTLVRPIVRHHHELLDGSGYPDGLAGDRIPLLAQVVGIVDAYDAMTTSRPYRRALSPQDAFDELRKDVRRGWRRSDLVEAFVHLALRDFVIQASHPTPLIRRPRMAKCQPVARPSLVRRMVS